jgi:hypothetical protein
VILESNGFFCLHFQLISGALSEGLWRYLRLNGSYGGAMTVFCAHVHWTMMMGSS